MYCEMLYTLTDYFWLRKMNLKEYEVEKYLKNDNAKIIYMLHAMSLSWCSSIK